MVYVISNVGAFGNQMVTIGLTRRLDPKERVRELGDASVPFKFDIHALLFSEDAVSLENKLHRALDDRRVNRVNLRREFFRATPQEVLRVLKGIDLNQYFLSTPRSPKLRSGAQAQSLNQKSRTRDCGDQCTAKNEPGTSGGTELLRALLCER
jgi:hypothetical protein